MISRTHRFHGYNSLRQVYQGGKTVRGPLFSLKVQLNNRRKDYRLAVVVSKKVEKSAVGRNRMRRRLYETVRNLEADFTGPYDIVLTVFSASIKDLPSSELKKQIESQLISGGILAKNTT